MIVILDICGKLSCGEERFQGDRRMMLIDHTRLADLQIQRKVDRVRVDKILDNQIEDAKAIEAKTMTHNSAVPLLNLVRERALPSPERTNYHHNRD